MEDTQKYKELFNLPPSKAKLLIVTKNGDIELFPIEIKTTSIKWINQSLDDYDMKLNIEMTLKIST